MTTKEMLTLARELVAKHLDRHVPVELDRAVRRLGCYHSNRYTNDEKITLSKHLAKLPEEKIRDTILHEIAHAIAGHAAGHGPKWKAACRQIGAIPERLYKDEDFGMVVRHKARAYANCPCGSFKNKPIYRMSRQWKTGAYQCAKCKTRITVTPHELEGTFLKEVVYG